MAITLTTKPNAARRETTVTASDSVHGMLYSTTSCGTGSRVAARLQEEARREAEAYLRRLLLASASNATETRLLAGRV